ncbi:MAG: ABC transporter ATP-binding protein [Spirochaetales bacterium]|nr:ABC transporter ATP-binding protein [Spirochaetales bacterium]
MNLRINDIHKEYTDFQLDLDLEVRQGEFLVLLGPSGCGKTTSLRLLAGFINPDSGTLRMNGRRIDTLPVHQRRIGLVFQDYALFPHLNVRENIAFGLKMLRWDHQEIKTRVEELLRLVSLEGYEGRKVTRLSGGEQQRVALARALAPKPELLLLDEPLSALDARLRTSLRAEIKRIQRELAVTTIYVTHDQEEALVLGDRIAVMRKGRIEQVDTPERIYNRPINPFVATFLGQANLLSGKIQGREEDYAIVESAFGQLKALYPEEGETTLRKEVTLFFRPEACDISGRGENAFHGTIVRKEYLGSHYILEVLGEKNQRFTLLVHRPPAEEAGDVISFTVDPERMSLFRSS